MKSVGCLTYLYDCLLSFDLKYLAFSHSAISESDINDLCILGEFDIVEDDEWAFYVKDGSVIDSGCDFVFCGNAHFLFLIL